MKKEIDMLRIRKLHEDWDEEIKSYKRRNKRLENVGKGAFIGFLIIISICFILGWVIV